MIIKRCESNGHVSEYYYQPINNSPNWLTDEFGLEKLKSSDQEAQPMWSYTTFRCDCYKEANKYLYK